MTSKTTWSAAALAILALTVASCGSGGIRGFSPDSDFFMTAQVKSGTPAIAATDIRCTSIGSDAVLSMTIDIVSSAVGGAGGTPPTSNLLQFTVDHYTVDFTNDTVPGGPVPASITVPVDFTVSVPGTQDLDGWPILFASQKSAAPLNDPANIPNGSIQLMATVTVWGHQATETQSDTMASFRVPVWVIDSCADPDPVLGCPPAYLNPLDGSFCP